jgi:hypothetical protein
MAKADDVAHGAFEAGKSGQFGPQNAVNAAIGQFGYETIKAMATEIPGLLKTATEAPVAPLENKSWAEQQQSIYNQGILQNNWT